MFKLLDTSCSREQLNTNMIFYIETRKCSMSGNETRLHPSHVCLISYDGGNYQFSPFIHSFLTNKRCLLIEDLYRAVEA